ncbi:GspH/FimT family pseudopilin [Oceaniserpentilla sp. 4NH20-0058]|uniref:GspH/FimT family pseudopilin n=1 Tax=Oceaniserpentilla sp. 4NH20-0058 TaxID=3127660 RepID=UPI0031041039
MRGFTLLELLVAMTILVSFLGLGIPKLNHFIDRHQAHTDILTLRRVLFQARSTAQHTSSHITVCPTRHNACSDDWQDPIRVFQDINLNNILDEDEVIYSTTDLSSNMGYWKKSKAKQNFVRFNPLGHAFSSASTFLYCPYSKHYELAKSIIINFQGRIRIDDYLNSKGSPYSKYQRYACE